MKPWRFHIADHHPTVSKSLALPSGNYTLKIVVGGPQGVGLIRAWPRRLLRLHNNTHADARCELCCAVHVRDKTLDLEFSGNLRFGEPIIHPAPRISTVFIAGDSTVCDQVNAPWCCWGQMLPCFLNAGIAVANYAKSGTASKTFPRRSILHRLRAGDFLLVQFAHNDQKAGFGHTEPFTTYKQSLCIYIEGARSKGAIPILVSPVHRAIFDENGEFQNSLGDYPEAVRQLATEKQVPLVDLSARSEEFIRLSGPHGAKLITVNSPPGRWPKYPDGIASRSHHSEYGAFELAKCVAREIRRNVSGLGGHVLDVPPTNLQPRLIGQWEAQYY